MAENITFLNNDLVRPPFDTDTGEKALFNHTFSQGDKTAYAVNFYSPGTTIRMITVIAADKCNVIYCNVVLAGNYETVISGADFKRWLSGWSFSGSFTIIFPEE